MDLSHHHLEPACIHRLGKNLKAGLVTALYSSMAAGRSIMANFSMSCCLESQVQCSLCFRLFVCCALPSLDRNLLMSLPCTGMMSRFINLPD